MKLPVYPSWVLTFLACVSICNGARILVVCPLPSPSHVILAEGVIRHLAEAGHDITYITPVPKKTHPPNVRHIDVSENFKHMPDFNVKSMIGKKNGVPIDVALPMMALIHNLTYHNPNVKKLLEDTNEHFDLVIAEWMYNEVFSGFAGIFNAPYIWLSTVEPHWMVLRLIDEVPHPAYTPDTLSSSAIPPLTFVQRVEELWHQAYGYYKKEIVHSDLEIYAILEPYFRLRGREPPNYDDLRFNASLMFGNSHVSLGAATRVPQNYIPIGGYHIDTDVAPLPDDLKKLFDTSKDGVIFFSLGSNLKSKDLPDEIKQGLLKVFGGLKQTVLWKFEEVLADRPKNVHIVQWAPQASILAHPNCVLFITHGGLLSTTETVYFAKPIIGIPIFADQFINVNRAVNKGFGIRVDLSDKMPGELKAALNEILSNPRYKKKVEELSFVYHHRIATPGEELKHWVDHVIKTRGAPHLRSPAIDIPTYQKLYLDLVALVLGVLFAIRAVIKFLFKKKTSKVKKQ